MLTSIPSFIHTLIAALTLLYLLVLVIAWWLLVGVLLDVTSGRALWSVGARYWTVLLAHIPTAGTSLGWYKPAGKSGTVREEELKRCRWRLHTGDKVKQHKATKSCCTTFSSPLCWSMFSRTLGSTYCMLEAVATSPMKEIRLHVVWCIYPFKNNIIFYHKYTRALFWASLIIKLLSFNYPIIQHVHPHTTNL